jgi:hypothetical protein
MGLPIWANNMAVGASHCWELSLATPVGTVPAPYMCIVYTKAAVTVASYIIVLGGVISLAI